MSEEFLRPECSGSPGAPHEPVGNSRDLNCKSGDIWFFFLKPQLLDSGDSVRISPFVYTNSTFPALGDAGRES